MTADPDPAAAAWVERAMAATAPPSRALLERVYGLLGSPDQSPSAADNVAPVAARDNAPVCGVTSESGDDLGPPADGSAMNAKRAPHGR